MKYRKAMPLKELYISGKNRLRQSGIENPELEASLLLSRTLGINVTDIYAHSEKEINADKVGEFNQLIQRRIKREPIAYILGEKEFYSRSFIVTPKVLIPRLETEILVEEALAIVQDISSPSIIDIGTGSGCIAVTISCECGNARVFATDISLEALRIALENVKRYDVLRRVSFICSDYLTSFKDKSFDIVLSNPPYISEGDLFSLEPDVGDFEPMLALLGGRDGLDRIRRIASQAKRVLKNGGWCILEVGAGQSERALEIFEELGFNYISFAKDLSGTKRVIKGKWIR
jgi:release factor glutamine methyltransferase